MLKCTFENGGETSLRHVTVNAIVVRKNSGGSKSGGDSANEEILLEKRATHLSNGGKYGLPGGYLDRDETIAQGMLRELREETGYEGKIIRLFLMNDNPNRRGEDKQNVQFLFLMEAGEKIGEGDQESSEVRWFPLDKLPPAEEFAFDHYESIALYKETFPNQV